jgi:hypothetical protein
MKKKWYETKGAMWAAFAVATATAIFCGWKIVGALIG